MKKTTIDKSVQDIPIRVAEQLLEIARRLPEATRSEFARNTTRRLSELALEHPRTIVFGAAGWIFGQIIDNVFTTQIPFTDIVIALTADKASDLGATGGALYGFFLDREKAAERTRVAKIVGEELRKATQI
jgi:membrane associated rhomboid family serine protease